MNSHYSLQDRGTDKNYQKYLDGMDSVIVEKIAAASAYFNPDPGNIIVDVGMASGTGTRILALLFPGSKVIGIDINPKMVEIAMEKNILPNLEFRLDDGETLATFEPGSVSGFFNCSSIHHITSYNGYDPNRAWLSLKRQSELLKRDGVLVIRDFVKPPDREVILELPIDSGEKRQGLTDPELLIEFSKTARSLAAIDHQGFPLKEIPVAGKSYRFKLMFSDALEFIRRKDYRNDWDVELKEEYGYYSQDEFEEVLAGFELRIIVSYPIYNPWIIKNRYEGKFRLLDTNGDDLGMPPTNYVIACEKVVNKGLKLKTVRHLPVPAKSFLEIKSYKDKLTNTVFELARRPHPVLDIVPYYFNSVNELFIIAKHGYPRPIINAVCDSAVIDNKHYSGYIIEGITAMQSDLQQDQMIKETLLQRANIKQEKIITTLPALKYYTSPGAVDELVYSVYTQIDGDCSFDETISNGYSGFVDSGSICPYKALQLIKAAQAGALPEARLEMNLYNLLRKNKIDPGKWIGEQLDIRDIDFLQTNSLLELIPETKEKRFAPSALLEDFIDHRRTMFTGHEQTAGGQTFEYIIPSRFSINTVVTLPLIHFKGEIYAGIEIRHLPVPQLQEGSSFIITAPASRVPKKVKHLSDLKNFLLNTDAGGARIGGFTKLGEKFFPCPGISPEQVYPFSVHLQKPTVQLKWVCLKELFQNAELLRDGHLLVTVFRVVHAAGLWGEYLNN